MKLRSWLAVLLPIAAWGTAQTARSRVTGERILEQYAIVIRVGHAEIPPAEGAAARAVAAVEESNAGGRLAGLDDDLNPTILDPEKVRAFLVGLAKLPPATLERLRGRTLPLNDSKLKLQAYSPVAPSSLAQGYALEVDEPSAGRIARARLDAPIDLKLARERADRARRAMQEADREAAALEEKKRQPDADSAVYVAQSTAERKRYAAAAVWRELTAMLAERDRKNAALEAEAAEARRAAAKYLVAPWTGMPR